MHKLKDILYIHFRVSNLARQQQFLQTFGFQIDRHDHLLLARGTDPSPYVYIAEEGEPGLVAVGFEAADGSLLDELAARDGVPVEDNPLPGGGRIVRLTDPNGHRIEVVHGIEPGHPLSVPSRSGFNSGERKERLSERVVLSGEPVFVKRLGHCVLMVKDFRESEQWYKERLGFLTSDEIYADPEMQSQVIGAFMRCDRGELPVDHHTLFLVHAGEAGFNHAAFEVADWDVLMGSHYELHREGYQHSFGVGKHILGSQVFDYWKDTDDFMLEHFTDGDLFDASIAPEKQTMDALLGTLWGPVGAPGQ